MIPIQIFYHVSDIVGWDALVNEKVKLMKESGLWDAADKIRFQLHYDPSYFEYWAATTDYLQNDPRIELFYFTGSHRPLGETYSIIYLHDHMAAIEENTAIFRFHTKGLLHRHTPEWPAAVEWNNYIDYWNIEQWKFCVSAIELGYDTVGANWWIAGINNIGHYSGNVWWASSNYLKTIPRLSWPHEVEFINQLGGFGNRQDAELWIGSGNPKHLELHHYEYSVGYHSPTPTNFRLKS